jgi:hypothetical protein
MEAICGSGLIFPHEGRLTQVQGIRGKAADGIRIHDLLHGNYGATRNRAPRMPSLAGVSRLGCGQARSEIRNDMRRYAAIWELRRRSARIREGGLILDMPHTGRLPWPFFGPTLAGMSEIKVDSARTEVELDAAVGVWRQANIARDAPTDPSVPPASERNFQPQMPCRS